jgi:hypothetical protein
MVDSGGHVDLFPVNCDTIVDTLHSSMVEESIVCDMGRTHNQSVLLGSGLMPIEVVCCTCACSIINTAPVCLDVVVSKLTHFLYFDLDCHAGLI